MKKIRDLLEMIKFSHTVFALPFALMAAVMAWAAIVPEGYEVRFGWMQLVGILVCMDRVSDGRIRGQLVER